MISDTLHDAIEEIRRYQSNYPQVYDPMRRRIDEVVDAMRSLQLELDTPPVGDITTEKP